MRVSRLEYERQNQSKQKRKLSCFLYTMKTAITAADRLNDKVLPFFESQELPADRGSEYIT